MNGIVRLKHIKDYKRVCYYSVVLDQDDEPIDKAQSLFELFIAQNETLNKDKLNHILAWLREIGNKYGASEKYFRPEQKLGEAVGLPPSQVGRTPVYMEDGETVANNLRLYCHRLNEDVVFLFSGDIKTKATAQECPNVKEHFQLANQLTNVIDESIKDDDIRWNDDYTDIDYDDDLSIPF